MPRSGNDFCETTTLFGLLALFRLEVYMTIYEIGRNVQEYNRLLYVEV